MKIFRTMLAALLLFPVLGVQAQDLPVASLQTELVFTIEAKIADAISMGETVDGSRQSIPITGGVFHGSAIKGEILPGGADYQLLRSDGSRMLTAVYMMRTDDGALINVINKGYVVPPGTIGNDQQYFRTSPTFTAPNGKYGWLNNQIFVSAVRFMDAKPNTVIIDVYRVL